MAIKINEIQVNVHFEQQQTENTPEVTSENNNCGNNSSNEEVIAKTVKEVLRILNERNER